MKAINKATFMAVVVCWLLAGGPRVHGYVDCHFLGDNRIAYMYTEDGSYSEQDAYEFCGFVEESTHWCRELCLDICESYTSGEAGVCEPFESSPEWDVEITCLCDYGYSG